MYTFTALARRCGLSASKRIGWPLSSRISVRPRCARALLLVTSAAELVTVAFDPAMWAMRGFMEASYIRGVDKSHFVHVHSMRLATGEEALIARVVAPDGRICHGFSLPLRATRARHPA